MEENKEENKNCANCPYNKCGIGPCCGYRCCGKRSCRIIAFIIIIAIAFCVGTMVGRDNDFRGRLEGQKFMNRICDTKENPNNSASGSATVNVLPETIPPVTQ